MFELWHLFLTRIVDGGWAWINKASKASFMGLDQGRTTKWPFDKTELNVWFSTALRNKFHKCIYVLIMQTYENLMLIQSMHSYYCKQKEGKGSFYIAQYPVRWTAQSALHFLPSLTDLFIPTPFSASPGSILARQQLITHISTTVYSQVLIYTAESTEAPWSERKCPNFETVAKGIRTRALSFYHWATALYIIEANLCT